MILSHIESILLKVENNNIFQTGHDRILAIMLGDENKFKSVVSTQSKADDLEKCQNYLLNLNELYAAIMSPTNIHQIEETSNDFASLEVEEDVSIIFFLFVLYIMIVF